MTDIRHASKQFLTQFIEIYRSHPALWKIKSKEYVNRNLKNAGYDAMVEFYRQVDPQADRELVTKKIQSMRGSFRKELRKLQKFNKSNAAGDEQYVPSLWYFDLLRFTMEHETSSESFDSSANSPSSLEETFASDTVNNLDEENSVTDWLSVIKEEPSVDPGIEEEKFESDELFFKTPLKKAKTKVTAHEMQGQTFVNTCTDPLKTCDEETDSTAFGKFVATKHAKLNEIQKMYAEAQIIKILHKAALNKLTDDT